MQNLKYYWIKFQQVVWYSMCFGEAVREASMFRKGLGCGFVGRYKKYCIWQGVEEARRRAGQMRRGKKLQFYPVLINAFKAGPKCGDNQHNLMLWNPAVFTYYQLYSQNTLGFFVQGCVK